VGEWGLRRIEQSGRAGLERGPVLELDAGGISLASNITMSWSIYCSEFSCMSSDVPSNTIFQLISIGIIS
jgi:hypothetical protein